VTVRLLHLLQLVSPALPVGGFSYSEGLEVLVQSGRLGDARAVADWLVAELERGALTIEAAALGPLGKALHRWRCEADPTALAAVVDLDGWLLAQRESAELRAQQRQMGQSLLELVAELGWPLPPPPASPPPRLGWPAAWAWAGLCLELEPLELVEGFLFSWVANQLSAAVRLVPLGASQAQRLQLALAPLIEERSRLLVGADPWSMTSGGVGAGLAQLGHAELYSRLFRS